MVSWFSEAIIYHILIDRFAGLKSYEWHKPRFLGGNLKGIISKLDYLQDLGINTIWLSPFYKTSEYHGYAVTDFYEVDPRFGTLADLQELIDKAHAADLHIIADFVPNHCSDKHPYFVDACENESSEYHKWFDFRNWPGDYICFLDVRSLPKFNLLYPAARDHIIEAARYWLNLGFDGFRLDHVIGPKHIFWRRFRKEIKADFPEAVLLGEAWMEGVRHKHLRTIYIRSKHKRWKTITQDQVQQEYYRELDGVLDFSFLNLLKDHFNPCKSTADLSTLKNKIERHFNRYPSDYFLATFLDNHDMNRFMFEIGNSKPLLFEAARIQFQYRQPVIIYYGTEAGMTHKRSVMEKRPHADLAARQPMIWDHQDTEIYNFYKELIASRRKAKSKS